MISSLKKDIYEQPMSLCGKTGDTKPTGDWQGIRIENGSTFYDMETKKVYMYDEEGQTWLEQ